MNIEENKELYAASESEKASLLDWYKDHSHVELHDDGLDTLCRICPPEKFGEDDDCEGLQNILRVMLYRIQGLESDLTKSQEKCSKYEGALAGILATSDKVTSFGASAAYREAYQLAEQALKPKE